MPHSIHGIWSTVKDLLQMSSQNVRDYESFTKFLPVRPYHRAVQCDQFWPKIGVILIFHEK